MLPIKRRSETRVRKSSRIELSAEQLFVKMALEGKNILVDACIGSDSAPVQHSFL